MMKWFVRLIWKQVSDLKELEDADKCIVCNIQGWMIWFNVFIIIIIFYLFNHFALIVICESYSWLSLLTWNVHVALTTYTVVCF